LPPPAATGAALEELRKARIKRQDSLHIVIIPRLLTQEWLRQLHKVTDLVFSIPPSQVYWSASMLEPLVVGLIFPFARSAPWQLRGTPKMLSVGRQMRRVFDTEDLAARNILRKLLLDGRRIPSLPPDVVWGLLYYTKRVGFPHQQPDGRGGNRKRQPSGPPSRPQKLGGEARSEGDYLKTRDGDSAVIPFECDTCIFRKLTKTKSPEPKNPQHILLMSAIRC
jgi:hypothetical protein